MLWLTPDGNEMTEADWNFPEGRFLSYVLGPMERGQQALYVVLNAAPEPIEFRLPKMEEYKTWSMLLHTADDKSDGEHTPAKRDNAGAAPQRHRVRRPAMNEGRFGPVITADGTTFRLWAPAAREVSVVIADRAHAMAKNSSGWFIAEVATARPGARYHYRVDGELNVPDPASSYQPDDVSGPSELIDHHQFQWKATDWRGRPWHETVILECHVGTFTPEGTYRAMIGKLDHLVATGITAIELMPLADFAGTRNWGYDGVLWYAPDHVYGTPDDLRDLIDQAHLRGLMVFLDVVYNHFGPEGNYLGRYAPQFFCDAQTPWGSAIDYRAPEVRAFVVENALHWLDNYRFDGLRLDAVHAITQPGEPSILTEISHAVGILAQQSGRHIHLVLENDDNRVALLDPGSEIPDGKYRAQWNDDYHHVWHVILTGETQGYYGDYASKPRRMLARMLRAGFAYQGEPSAHRERPATRRADRHTAACRLRQLSPESRPDRQPRAGRSP